MLTVMGLTLREFRDIDCCVAKGSAKFFYMLYELPVIG
jgi:hypothetical protein